MLRMSDGAFVNDAPSKDTVVAVRIQDGEYYFLGWMEDAENYDMQIAINPNWRSMHKRDFCDKGSLYNEISNTLFSVYGIKVENIKSENPYRDFISYIRNKNGNFDDEVGHNIIVLSECEMRDIIKLLKDGDYVFYIV